jgi:hypothetical protein
VVKNVPEDSVRAEKLIGFDKFGLCKDLPADRKQKRGVFLSDLQVIDAKVNWLLAKMAHGFVYKTTKESTLRLIKFIKNNRKWLEAEAVRLDLY